MSQFFVISYKMPDGSIKSVMERGDMVAKRKKYLEWAKLPVVSVTKKRET